MIEKFVTDLARETAREEARKIVSEMLLNSKENKPEGEEKYLSAKQVCEKLGISLMTLTRHRNSGRVPAHRFGGRVLYLLSEVEAVMISTQR